MTRKIFIIFTLIFIFRGTEASAPKPQLDWGFFLSANSMEQVGAYLEGLRAMGIENVVLDKAYFDAFQKKASEIKTMVKKFKLDDVGMEGGVLENAPSEKQWENWEAMGRFVQEIGGEFLIVNARKRDAYPPGQAEINQLAATLSELAFRLKKYKVKLVFKNQLHSICQTGEEFQWMLQATQGKPIKFQVNTADFIQSGSGNFDYLRKLKKRVEVIGFQGLISPKPGHQGSKIYDYKLTSIDQPGKIDFKAHFLQLKHARVNALGLLRVEESTDLNGFLQKAKDQIGFLKQEFGYRF